MTVTLDRYVSILEPFHKLLTQSGSNMTEQGGHTAPIDGELIVFLRNGTLKWPPRSPDLSACNRLKAMLSLVDLLQR